MCSCRLQYEHQHTVHRHTAAAGCYTTLTDIDTHQRDLDTVPTLTSLTSRHPLPLMRNTQASDVRQIIANTTCQLEVIQKKESNKKLSLTHRNNASRDIVHYFQEI